MKAIHLVLGVGLACCSQLLCAAPAAAQTCSNAGGCDSAVSSDYSEVHSGRYNTISSGSAFSVISGGYGNLLSSSAGYGTIVGGHSNTVSSYGRYNTVGGGSHNYIFGGLGNYYGDSNTIAGGYDNRMTNTSDYAFIGAGKSNRVNNGWSATIGGGEGNLTADLLATIGGGYHNTASGSESTVLGGYQNTASGNTATALGGSSNVASGLYAVTVGGALNTSSAPNSFAAGRQANANQSGCFVWADALGYPMSCTMYPTGGIAPYSASNAFIVRAVGGVELITGVNGSGTPNAGVYLYTGSSTWSLVSDRNKKHDFQPVDARDVLRRLAAIPITTWKYDAEVSGARHMGPMAQDLFAAFGLGDDDKHVTSIDEDGIALAAIQGLHAELVESDATIDALAARATAARKKHADLVKASAEAHRRALDVEKELAAIEAALGLDRAPSK